ncbi:MAG: nucleoside recognition domain-containing protein, partial [Bacillota bacterium]|nr:nucleoside recognition domain-containing protein [Bacillota bacterium]
TIRYDEAIEEWIARLSPSLQPLLQLLARKGLRVSARWLALRLLEGDRTLWSKVQELVGDPAIPCPAPTVEADSIRDRIVSALYRQAEEISTRVVRRTGRRGKADRDRSLDGLLTSRLWGYPSMLALLGLVFWLTLSGANYPSALLGRLLFGLQDRLSALFLYLGTPAWLHGLLVLGMYRCLAWVVSVMLPPMAIFFPLFTLLEDLGYLPRVAFNLDHFFRRAGAHGKQALTMSMGFGCNAAGVVACRIIDSPRERLIAMLTNNFVPCNGRFPTLITLATLLASGAVPPTYGSLAAAGLVAALVLLGVALTLGVSWGLSHTLLRGAPSSFALELPPYRPPQVGRVIIRSLFDRTLFVLGRAVTVAAPAGAVTWLLANLSLGNRSLIAHLAGALAPLGRGLGLDGYILTAFLLGLPANEIVLPILLMGYLSAGSLLKLDSLTALREVLQQNGWTWLTAFNAMLLTLLHYPCGTTLLTIRKEAGHAKWALLAALIPTALGIGLCFATAQAARLLGLAYHLGGRGFCLAVQN